MLWDITQSPVQWDTGKIFNSRFGRENYFRFGTSGGKCNPSVGVSTTEGLTSSLKMAAALDVLLCDASVTCPWYIVNTTKMSHAKNRTATIFFCSNFFVHFPPVGVEPRTR